MAFNELNSVEHYIIHQLTGVNLNGNAFGDTVTRYAGQWEFKTADEIQRGINEVMVEPELKEALVRLNPEIAKKPSLADEVIYKLRAVFLAVNPTMTNRLIKTIANG